MAALSSHSCRSSSFFFFPTLCVFSNNCHVLCVSICYAPSPHHYPCFVLYTVICGVRLRVLIALVVSLVMWMGKDDRCQCLSSCTGDGGFPLFSPLFQRNFFDPIYFHMSQVPNDLLWAPETATLCDNNAAGNSGTSQWRTVVHNKDYPQKLWFGLIDFCACTVPLQTMENDLSLCSPHTEKALHPQLWMWWLSDLSAEPHCQH